MPSMEPRSCPGCGALIRYDGLCWRCREEQSYREYASLTPGEVEERQRALAEEIRRSQSLGAQAEIALRWLLCCHGTAGQQPQQAALESGCFHFPGLYYRAPAEGGEGLADALLRTEKASEASRLMECLAMQGGDRALAVLLELERSPRPWRAELYVDPSVYAQYGGWTFDREGRRQRLVYEDCYPLKKDVSGGETPVQIGRPREDRCPHCGGRMVDMLSLDCRDPRLAFLGLEGIVTAACCPSCICYMEAAYSRYSPAGDCQPLPGKLLLPEVENDVTEEEYRELTSHAFTLGAGPVSPFYGAMREDTGTLGGFANWLQDWSYTLCPDCGRPMVYLAQIPWEAVTDGAEGTLFIEVCPHCHIASMQHQQT